MDYATMDDRQQTLHAFETLLDASPRASEPVVELHSLGRLCARGIPAHPPHLRPLAWAVLLGVIPPDKAHWRAERRNLRRRYDEMVKRGMRDLGEEDEPHYPLSREDKALLRLANDTRTTLSAQRTLFDVVDGSARCPLDGPQGGKYDAESSGSSSSEDLEGVRGGPSGTGTTEGAARREGDVLGDAAGRSDTTRTKAKTSRPEPLLTRRRLFERVERIIAAQRAEADAERRFTAKKKGKGLPGHEAAAPSTAGSPAGPGTSSPGSVPVLSPAVVLSPSDAQALRRPTREEKSAEAAGGGLRVRTAPRLAVAAVPDGDASQGSAASSPITLVSPHEIKRVGGSGAPKQDTHADRILRLLYVFAQNGLAHTYAGSTAPDLPPGIAHLAALLYTVFAQQSLGRTNPHAEADAYWGFVALMGKIGAVVLGEGKGEEARAAGDALRRLDGRVRWADDALYRGLALRSLQPSLGHYAYRWVVLLLAGDLPHRACLPLLDFIIAEPAGPAADEGAAKLDLLLDVCTAMLLLVKPRLLARRSGSRGGAARKSMWDGGDAESAPGGLTEEEVQDATMRGVALLRAYPVASVGVPEILRVAWEIRQQRLLAATDGEGPDDIVWPADEGPVETSQAMTRISEAASAAAGAISSRIGAPSVDLGKYTASLQESDAAASLAKAGSNLTAAALSRWESLQATQATTAPTWLKGGVGSLWKRPAPQASANDTAPLQRQSDLSLRLAALTLPKDAPGADLYRRDTNMPPTFISPSGSIVYPQGRYRRSRGVEHTTQNSMGSRLSALVESVSSAPISPPSGAKPLLLSGSARPASPYSPASNVSGTPGSHLSPSSVDSLDAEHGLSRKISLSRPKRASADAGSTPTQTASARLRNATRTGRPRAGSQPSVDIGSGSDGTHVRFALRDPGAGPAASAAAADSGSESAPSRYRLVDSPVGVPDAIEESTAESPVRKGMIARRYVVKRGGRPRPPDLQSTRGQTLERQSSASTVDSRRDSLADDAALVSSWLDDRPADVADSRTPVIADFAEKPHASPKAPSASLPRSPRIIGSSPGKHAGLADKASRPSSLASYLTSDGEVGDAESNDESDQREQ